MEKASEMARLMNIEFQPSNGWLARWKANENVSFHKLQGEKEATDSVGAANWMAKFFPDLVKDYDSQDICNADETGLYFKALPAGMLTVDGEKPSGGKSQKDRITILFLCNQEGLEKFVFSIEKLKSPRCFQRVRNLPVKYYSYSTAWMMSEIWTQLLVELNQKLHSQKRKIILFIDNATCHKLKEETRLQRINIVYFPPNTISLIQLLDQGTIRSFMAHYHHLIIRKQIAAIEQDISAKDFLKTVDVSQESEVTDDNQTNPNAEDLGVCAEDFTELVSCDQELECYGELTDLEIATNIQGSDKNDSNDESGEVVSSFPIE
uniref:HTH CENPB-type domain-containing protein n=1 Tax=Plectus sambesii TaxID=2011161 RepID=A0A914VF84_9BILA